MTSKFWFWFNLGAGILNLIVYLYAQNPKWYTVTAIAISFFCAGCLLGEDD